MRLQIDYCQKKGIRMAQTTSNVCARCEARFAKWSDYHSHVTTVKCVKVFRPINLSGRTREQIVRDWEAKQKQGVFIQ